MKLTDDLDQFFNKRDDEEEFEDNNEQQLEEKEDYNDSELQETNQYLTQDDNIEISEAQNASDDYIDETDEAHMITSSESQLEDSIEEIEAGRQQLISKEVTVTESQERVIKFPVDAERTLQIIAGPGSGKTLTLCYKIAYMIEHLDYQPEEILILSLTNKAVDNMKQALLDLIRDQELVDKIQINTFHGFSIQLIRELDKSYEDMDIIQDEVNWATVTRLMATKGKLNKYKIRKILKDLKERDGRFGRSLSEDSLQDVAIIHHVSVSTIKELLRVLKSMKVLTSDDIISLCVNMLEEREDIELAHKVTIVDEFQDMYPELFKITKAVSKNTHLVVSGDSNQSIYSFLGSNPQSLENELSKIKPIDQIEMRENFRSTPQIIKAANYLMFQGQERTRWDTPENFGVEDGPYPVIKMCDYNEESNEFIANEINSLLYRSQGIIKLSDIAILTRTNQQIDQLERELQSFGIKAHKLSSSPPWTSNDLFHFVEYLKIVNNPYKADFSILSTLNLVPKVGEVSLKNIHQTSMKTGKPVYDIIQSPTNVNIYRYYQQIDHFVNSLDRDNPDDVFNCAIALGDQLGLSSHIAKKITETKQQELILKQLTDLKENLNLIAHMKPYGITLLEYFSEHYSDLLPTSLTENSVTISTIHSSKGLEYPIVFIPHLKPYGHKSNWGQFDDGFRFSEEDKRVQYVAMTRAKSLLYMTMNTSDMKDPATDVFPKDITKNSFQMTSSFLKNFQNRNVGKFNGHNLPYSLTKSFYRAFHSLRYGRRP